jgi:hypothetical protein
MLAPSGDRSRGEVLPAVNAMFKFPPAQDSSAYDSWRAHINAPLEYACQCPEPARACSQSHYSPAAGPTNNPVPLRASPAMGAPAQPAAKDPEYVSIGSFVSHPVADTREIINDR